jgi:hypothetical protein
MMSHKQSAWMILQAFYMPFLIAEVLIADMA